MSFQTSDKLVPTKLSRQIAAGGMGEVYLHLRDGRFDASLPSKVYPKILASLSARRPRRIIRSKMAIIDRY